MYWRQTITQISIDLNRWFHMARDNDYPLYSYPEYSRRIISVSYQLIRPRAPSQYPKRRLSVRSRQVSKPRDMYLELSDRSEIWWIPISWLQDLTRSYEKTSFRLLRRGPGSWCCYSISQEICTRFLLCCASLWLYIDWFPHIHQAYFTGTVAI